MAMKSSQNLPKGEQLPYIRSIQNLEVITERVDDLIAIVGPSTRSETQRQQLYMEVAKIITDAIADAVIIPYGSFQSHCYLYNSDIDFCCWLEDGDEETTARMVYDLFKQVDDVKSLFHVDAEVEVIKFVYHGVGFDISFSQPSGVLTAYFLELLDEYVGKNHLLKRSLILLQCYCAHEAHVLGSHNFMLSSYSLRTMVIYILLHQPQICTPLQTLYAFLAYFSSFDFQNSVLTIFGAVPRAEFEEFPSVETFFEAQATQFTQRIPGQSELDMVKKVRLFVSLRVASDVQIQEEMGIRGCISEYIEGVHSAAVEPEQEIVEKSDNSEKTCKQTIFDSLNEQLRQVFNCQENVPNRVLYENIARTSEEDISAAVADAIQEFLREAAMTRLFRDERQQFEFRCVNISDPLLPSNNIGKTVSEASLKRMNRVFRLGYFNIRKLLTKVLDGHFKVAECVAEFDMNFVNTLATCDVGELAMIADHNFDVLRGDQTSLENACMSIIYQGMGMSSKARIFCDK